MITKACQEFSECYTFDEAISKTGYGRFHYKISSVCALCILCVGFQNGLSSYVFSAAQCEMKFLPQDLGLLNISFLLGGTISAFLWGMIADMKGRKKILVITMLLDSAITLICSIMQNFNGVIICRFLNGVLIGCPGSVTFTYLAEFHSPKHRAKSVCYSGIAFIAAWVLLPVLSFLILSLDFKLDLLCINYTPWRVFLVIIALPELLAGLLLFILPESPKFLHDKNHSDKALMILTNMYCQNMNKESKDFSVKKLGNESNFETDTYLKHEDKHSKFLHTMCSQIKKLFSAKIRIKTLLLCLIMLSNMFGYFGLGLWLPEFFIRFERHYQIHPDKSITLTELEFSEKLNTAVTCSFTFDINTFRNTLIVASSALLCNALAGWVAGTISVRNLALATMVFGGISSLSIYWIRSTLGILIASSIFQSAMATGNMVIGGIVVEQFPTSVAAMALSLVLCVGRIGAIASNFIFSVLLGKDNGAVIFIVSSVLLLGAILCIPIPSNVNTKEGNDKEGNTIDRDYKMNDISVISNNESNNVTVQND